MFLACTFAGSLVNLWNNCFGGNILILFLRVNLLGGGSTTTGGVVVIGVSGVLAVGIPLGYNSLS